MDEQNEEQAPRRDLARERAIRQRTDGYGGDPLWAVRRAGESDTECIERIANLARLEKEAQQPAGIAPIIDAPELKRCQASHGDGECIAKMCPQTRDGEPMKSGRTCPLPWAGDEE